MTSRFSSLCSWASPCLLALSGVRCKQCRSVSAAEDSMLCYIKLTAQYRRLERKCRWTVMNTAFVSHTVGKCPGWWQGLYQAAWVAGFHLICIDGYAGLHKVALSSQSLPASLHGPC